MLYRYPPPTVFQVDSGNGVYTLALPACLKEGGPANNLWQKLAEGRLFQKNRRATPFTLEYSAQLGTFVPAGGCRGSSRPLFFWTPHHKNRGGGGVPKDCGGVGTYKK